MELMKSYWTEEDIEDFSAAVFTMQMRVYEEKYKVDGAKAGDCPV